MPHSTFIGKRALLAMCIAVLRTQIGGLGGDQRVTAEELIERLDLAPHPEGGWYRETFRSTSEPGLRAAATAVYYVIQPGQTSHWNRVDADELWLWHGGDPLVLQLADRDDGPVRTQRLGGQVNLGEQPQVIVPAGCWQAAEPIVGEAGYTFLSCVVAPGFEFSGYELAPAGWVPGGTR